MQRCLFCVFSFFTAVETPHDVTPRAREEGIHRVVYGAFATMYHCQI